MSFSLRQGGFAGGKGVPEDRGTPNDRDCTRQMACIGHLKYFSEETLGTPQEFSWRHTYHLFFLHRRGFRGGTRGPNDS